MWKNLRESVDRPEGLSQLPDGNFLPPIEMNCIEDYFAAKVSVNYKDRRGNTGPGGESEQRDGRGGDPASSEIFVTGDVRSADISAVIQQHCRGRRPPEICPLFMMLLFRK